MASLISPTVAWARAASMHRASRLPSPRAPSVSADSASRQASSSRSARSVSSFASCSERTRALSTLRISIGSSSSTGYWFTPMSACRPESNRAWVRAAASSMRSFGNPASIALAIPPAASTSWMCAQARCARSWVSVSMYALPPHGSTVCVVPDSCCSSSWVLRAMRAEKSVGSAIASSNAFVCRLCVCPWVAAMASMPVRTTLL